MCGVLLLCNGNGSEHPLVTCLGTDMKRVQRGIEPTPFSVPPSAMPMPISHFRLTQDFHSFGHRARRPLEAKEHTHHVLYPPVPNSITTPRCN